MKTPLGKRKTSGLTLIEALVVICVIAILVVVLLPSLSPPNTGGSNRRYACIFNFQQIGAAVEMFENQNGGKLPMQLSATNRGSMESISVGQASPHFKTLSDYFDQLRVFVCPQDKDKHPAANRSELCDRNLSYFINVDATVNNPANVILAGHRNLQANGQPVKSGLFELTTNLEMNWTHEWHMSFGILLFADGHVDWVGTNNLDSFVRNQPLATNRLAVP